jgi:hypothetical protein
VVGKPYWVTGRLFEFAAQQWRTIDGVALTEGVNLLQTLRESPSRFLNAIYVFWIRTAKDEAERFKIESQLKAPPAWDKKPAVTQQRQTAKSFDAAAASLTALQGED